MSKFTKIIALASLALAGASGTAFAQEATYEYPLAATSATTRAQVEAERAQAKRDGAMRVWATSYNHMAAAKSLKTRAEVRAEVLATDRAELGALTGEDSGSFALARRNGGVRNAGALLAAR